MTSAAKTMLVTYALNAAWQAPLIAAVAWMAARLLRREGAARVHGVWAAALVLEAVLPASGSLRLWMRLALASLEGGAADRTGSVTAQTGVALPLGALAVSGWMTDAVCAAMVAITAYFGARFLWSLAGTGRLRREARPLELDMETQARWKALCRRMSVRAPLLASCHAVAGPVIVGLGDATLLLPPGFPESLSAEDMEAALAHELAHVRRRDFLRHLAAQVLAIPLRWHPVTWLVLAQLDETREAACDAMAADALDGPRSYARSLLQLASLIQQRSLTTPPHALGFFESGTLERRLMHLTQPVLRPHLVQRIAATGLALVLTSGVCASAFALHVGVVAPAPQDAAMSSAPSATAKPMTVKGGIMAGQIVSKVNPVYPSAAKAAKIEGAVLLKAIIGKGGQIENLTVISGPKELQVPSIEAVRQWVYKPFLLNGAPVAVETIITVNYALAK